MNAATQSLQLSAMIKSKMNFANNTINQIHYMLRKPPDFEQQ
jgi:hypothetical protein